jgi:molybdate transport system substrate-binding protein
MARLRVMSSVAIRFAYEALAPGFERERGVEVVTDWVPTVEMMRRLGHANAGGEETDLVLMASGNIEALIAQGVLEGATRRDVVRSGIGVAVRAGAALPDLSSVAALEAALRDAPSVAYSTGPSGVYLKALFARLGWDALLAGRLREVQGVPVAELVARGEVALGFQQVPEIVHVQGAVLAGPLPQEIQSVTTFAAALHVKAVAREEARAWVAYLRTPEAARVMRENGLEGVVG